MPITTSNPLRILHALQLGKEPPTSLVYRSELTSLTHLYPTTSPLNPLPFPSLPAGTNRHTYVTQLCAPPDEALLALASTDGRVEIHEPADTATTLRLSLRAPPLRGAQWARPSGIDTIFVNLSHRAEVHMYNLETCNGMHPTRTLPLSTPRATTCDLAAHDEIIAVSTPSNVVLFDVRLPRRAACISVIRTAMQDAVVSLDDTIVYAADSGAITMWDRRSLRSSTLSHASTLRAVCMGRNESQTPRLLTRVVGNGTFNMIRLVPRAPQACVAFHLRDGMAGHVDMGSGYFETTREPTARCGHLQMREAGGANGTGLIEYGSTARDMSSYPWFVQRWRGQIMQATFGKGWRLLVPMVQRPGFRVVAFAKDLEIQSFERGTGFHFSCARGLEGGLERILLAGVCNNVQILEVDFRRTWNREKDVACV